MIRRTISQVSYYWRTFILYLLIGFVLGILFTNLSWKYRMGEDGLFTLLLFANRDPATWKVGYYFRYLLRQRVGNLGLLALLGLTALGLPVVAAEFVWGGFLAGAWCTMGILETGMEGFLVMISILIPQMLCCLPGLFLFGAVVCLMSDKSRSRIPIDWKGYGCYVLWCLPGFFALVLGTFLESFLSLKILQIIIKTITKN